MMQGDTHEKTYRATEARDRFSEIFDTAYFGQRVFIEKRNRKVAVVSMELLERIDAILEQEAIAEAKEADKALKEFQSQGGKTMEQIKQELDMD